jgi:hypothetical protein
MGTPSQGENVGAQSQAEGEMTPPVLSYARPRKRERMNFRDVLWYIALILAAMVVLTMLVAMLFPPTYHW